MQFTIHKNKHRARPLQLRLWWNKNVLRRVVNFDFSCKYDTGQDQTDWNKLFGVGYLPTHHRNSARLVWRYNPDIQKIDIGWYVYDKGKRHCGFLASIPFHFNCLLELFIDPDYYHFTVWNEVNVEVGRVTVPRSKTTALCYSLGGYFGGNRKAPHTMNYSMKTV